MNNFLTWLKQVLGIAEKELADVMAPLQKIFDDLKALEASKRAQADEHSLEAQKSQALASDAAAKALAASDQAKKLSAVLV